MRGWEWLAYPEKGYDWCFVRNVLVKAMLLFVLLNVMYALLAPGEWINRNVSIYNTFVPGRERLPYSDNPTEAYNLSLGSIEGLFASHIIHDGEKADDEFRVAIIGDSSVWGVLLTNDQTLTACLNQGQHTTADGSNLSAYNLGYPVLSLTKDLLILDQVLEYDVDAVVWMTTLQAFFDLEQLRHPIVQNNFEVTHRLANIYDLDLNLTLLDEQSFWDRTLVGQRQVVANWLRLQIYGLAWWMTNNDYAAAEYLGAPMRHFPEDSLGVLNQPEITLGNLNQQDVLAWDVLYAGMQMTAEEGIPVLVVNEPIYISNGVNSDLRYNEYYPRWAYDEFRLMLAERANQESWRYVDLWDVVPGDSFTDTPFHYNAVYVCQIAERLVTDILALAG